VLRYALFDLDETLYSSEAGVMQQLSHRIDRYMIERVGLAPEYARDVRPSYWRTYGTTLRGLMQEHDVDPTDYLAFVHDFRVDQYLAPDPILAQSLRAFPLEKVIFTNSSADHCQRVMEALGIREQFTRVFDIVSVGYRNKPDSASYHSVLLALEADGGECMMIDDNLANLRAAGALGMTTVHVGPERQDVVSDFALRRASQIGTLVPKLVAQGLLNADQAHP